MTGASSPATGFVSLAGDICRRHLAWLGIDERDAVPWRIAWQPSGYPGGAIGSEPLVQAISGLMEVHGRQGQRPRRLGLDVASVAAGILAAQGVLAATMARRRDHTVDLVETSVLDGAMTYLGHHLTTATCGDPWALDDNGVGPPFPTSDGEWVEVEMLTPETWRRWWEALGVPGGSDVDQAWLAFAFRANTGRCSLPDALHQATSTRTFGELVATARRVGAVSLCRIRTQRELLTEMTTIGPPWRLAALDAVEALQVDGETPRAAEGASAAAAGLLEGIRVVEATSRVQGPLAGLLLRMLGADVLKIEPPGGDAGRLVQPAAGEQGAAFLAYHRGKRSIEIDYKQESGRHMLARLVADADVFLHNWPDGRAERLGLSAADLASGHPGLVYAHASGWGDQRPDGATLATDYLVQAHSGLCDGLGGDGRRPSPSPVTLADVMGGLVAAEAVLAALCRRQATGRGCRVDTSLYAAAIALQAPVLQGLLSDDRASRCSARAAGGTLTQPLVMGDGFLMVDASRLADREKLARLCGVRPSDASDAIIAPALARCFGDRAATDCEHALTSEGVPAAVVCTDLSRLSADPRVAPVLEWVPEGCWAPARPWRFSQ